MRRGTAVTLVLASSLAVGGCSAPAADEWLAADPAAAAHEVVGAAAAGRTAIGGEWLGSWNRTAVRCGDGGDQFRGYFEQQPSGDQDASERSVRDAWSSFVDDENGADIVRTDRPGRTMQVLLERDDGFLVLMTVTDSKTSFIATSACFDGTADVDAERLLPQSEPGVTVF